MNHFIINNEKENKSVIDQFSQNMFNYTSCKDNNTFNQWMSRNGTINEETNNNSSNEKEGVDSASDIEAIEKECINNMIEDSMRTEEADEFFFTSHNDLLNGHYNNNKFHFKKGHTHYNDDEFSVFLEKDSLFQNIISFDMNNENFECSPPKNSDNGCFSLLNKNSFIPVNGNENNNCFEPLEDITMNNDSKNINNNNMETVFTDENGKLEMNCYSLSKGNKMNSFTKNVMLKNNKYLANLAIDMGTNKVNVLENKYKKEDQSIYNSEYIFNKHLDAHSKYSIDNNNNNNANLHKVFKNMIINLIETGDNDIELFERIIDIINDHYKSKNIAKSVDKLESGSTKSCRYNNNKNDNKECTYNHNMYFMKKNYNNEINNIDNTFYIPIEASTKISTASQFASQVNNCKKQYEEELNMTSVIKSTMKGNTYINGSIITDSYSNALKNQLNADAALEKEQILSQLKREVNTETETKNGRKNIIEETEQNKKINDYTNGKISTVKFNFETDVVENSRKFREEMKAEGLTNSLKHFQDGINRNAIGQQHTDITSTNANITHFLNNDNNENKKWSTNNTFGIQSFPIKDLKNFFSESSSKDMSKLHSENLSRESKGNKLWNHSLHSKVSNGFSKNIKTDGFNLKNDDISKNMLCREGLFKKKNVNTTTNKINGSNSNASSSNNNDNMGDLRKSCKNVNTKSILKSKNVAEIEKVSASELKNLITKSDELCLKSMLESLYEDRILPLLFNLNGRAEEMKCKEIIRKNLFTAYSLFPTVYEVKKAKTGDDYVVMFVNKAVSDDYFIYLNNTEDNYDEIMWKHFSEYLEKIAKEDDPSVYEFSGGRYGMAKELKKRNLFFFEKLCLGEICQIVHLSTNKKLIAYEHNFLKPISKCHKYSNAKLGILNVVNENKEDFITTMEELKYYIKSLLKYYKGGFNISTLKKKLKTRFNKQICESVFHCIKLIEVLQLEELKEVCVVDKDLKFIRAA